MCTRSNSRQSSFVASAAAILVLSSLLVFSSSAFAHTPHHAIDALQISPDYENDSTLFILVQNNLLRSVNRGATWKQLTNGLDSAYLLSDVAASPAFAADGVLFASTDGSGVYVSRDSGQSFVNYSTGLAQPNIGMLEIVSVADQVFVFAAGSDTGLFVSAVDAPVWRRVLSDDIQILSMHVVQDDTGTYVLAGDSEGGVWKSNSDLMDWQRMFRLESSGGVSALAVSHGRDQPDAIYVGTRQAGLLRTNVRGTRIESVSDKWPSRTTDCRGRVLERPSRESNIRSINLSENSDGYTSIRVATWHQGVLVSDDGGETWATRNEGVSCDHQADEPAFRVPQFRDLGITAGNDWFLAGFNGLFRSENAGETWVTMDTLPVSLIRGFDVAMEPSGSHAIAIGTYGGGAYLSRDEGQSWLIMNHGLKTTRLADVQFAPDGRLYGLAKEHLLIESTNVGSWEPLSLVYRGWRKRIGAGLERRLGFSPRFGTKLFLNEAERGSPWPMQVDLSPAYESDQTMFVGLRTHGIWKSENAGIDWSRTWEGPVDYVTSIELSPDYASDRTVFAAIRGSGIMVSRDAGQSWYQANKGIRESAQQDSANKPNYVNDPPLQRAINDASVAASPAFASDHTLFAGTSSGLFMSTDGAENWVRQTVVAEYPDLPISAFAVSPEYGDDRTLLVTLKGRGLFRSTDGGQSFTPAGRDLLDQNINLKYMKFSPAFSENTTVFGASDESVVVSRDAGQTWTVINRPARYEDWRGAGEGPVRFSAGWSRVSGPGYSASSLTSTESVGASASLVFHGSNLTWLGERCAACGTADLAIDGRHVSTADLFSEETVSDVLLSIDDLDDGPHTLQITVSGTKNTRSAGHRVTVDAFDVVGQ